MVMTISFQPINKYGVHAYNVVSHCMVSIKTPSSEIRGGRLV
jgi:hypothetical protein